jgi:tetratricopeptide (TPR) repeat protein
VSVILEALRRAGVPARSGAQNRTTWGPPVPAGLGLGAERPRAESARSTRTGLLIAGGVIAAAIVIGLGIRGWLTSVFEAQRPAPSSARALPIPASTPTEAPAVAPSSGSSTRPVAPERAERETAPPVGAAPGPRRAGVRRAPPARGRDFDLAIQYQQLGQLDLAREHYLAALAEDGLNVEARNNLGVLFYEQRRPDDAIEQLRRASLARPDYVNARSNLAVVLMSLGRFAEARAQLRAALTLAPSDADLLVNLALVEKGDGHPEAAIELLSRALGYQPSHDMAHYNLAVLYDQDRSTALATEHYEAFLAQAGPERAAVVADVERRLRALTDRRAP